MPPCALRAQVSAMEMLAQSASWAEQSTHCLSAEFRVAKIWSCESPILPAATSAAAAITSIWLSAPSVAALAVAAVAATSPSLMPPSPPAAAAPTVSRAGKVEAARVQVSSSLSRMSAAARFSKRWAADQASSADSAASSHASSPSIACSKHAVAE
eukprot:CAMPEP_0115715446 /NCGR_PEP_ID=MMETSP0272-20121206/75793_1 /TAXON_ID=71861 /ORGANISM="Scrippsiella trochoidea, Strain CCMP3099" /LENGTH=155 /DNA_ID=CAMNT_0003157691 /DNA_START=157 /DNA_END=622 /DNA_ORIENTATION=+